MKVLSLLLMAAVLLSSCSADSATSAEHKAVETTTASATANVQQIGSQEAKALLAQQPEVMVLDVRTPGEYAAGHLQNATLVDFTASDFSQRLQALDRSKTYLVYCAVGGRSRQATQQMQQLGFQQVYDAGEGFSALKDAGIPAQ